MAESLESRKFERKGLFDVPLPMRRAKEASAAESSQSNETPPGTMAFSLMTRRGNRQQVCFAYLLFSKIRGTDYSQSRTIDLPSDSSFAVAMKNQQQAEREEQQRIKNLVLNYDLGDDNDMSDGEDNTLLARTFPLERNPNAKGREAPEKRAFPQRTDKTSASRGFRARRLQLSDVDWYASDSTENPNPNDRRGSQPKRGRRQWKTTDC